MIPVLAQALEVSNNQLGLGVMTALLAQHFVLRKYIRQQAGVKEVSTTEISGQPIRFTNEEHVLTKAEHVEHCSHMERRVVALEARTDRIEHKMDLDKKEIIASGEERCILIHNRINDIDRKVSALDERTLTTNATLSVANAKMDRVLERLKA